MRQSLFEAQTTLLEQGGEKELIFLLTGDDPGSDAKIKAGWT